MKTGSIVIGVVILAVATAIISFQLGRQSTQAPATAEQVAVLPTERPTETTIPIVATSTQLPLPTDVLTPTYAPEKIVDDFDQVQEQAGVIVKVKGGGILSQMPADLSTFLDVESTSLFGSISVVVTNTTTGKINIHPDMGTIVVGSEQVQGQVYFGNDVGGEFFPSVVKEGDVVFVLKRTTWEQIKNGIALIYEIDAPSNETFQMLSDKPYRFTLQLK
jgi:hypothetical protein